MAGERERGASPTPSGRALVASAALVAIGAALLGTGAPTWWLGAGAIAAAGALIIPSLRPSAAAAWASLEAPRTYGFGRRTVRVRWRPILAEVGALALIAATVTTLLYPAAAGELPVSGDHPVHFAKIANTLDTLAETGSPLGWTHDVYAGAPLNYLYPFGADLFVGAVAAVGLGGGELSGAYGVAFWLFYLGLGWAVFRFGAAVASRPVGLVAALLYVTSAGGPHAGGFEYALYWGVWPQWLATAFAYLALARLPRLVEGADLRAVAGFGLWMGVALLTHPVWLVGVGLAAVAVALAWAWTGGVARPWLGMGRLGLAGALAGMIACAWLLPFMSTRDITDDRGFTWTSAYDLGADLLHLDAFDGVLPVVLALALIGLGHALWRRPRGLAGDARPSSSERQASRSTAAWGSPSATDVASTHAEGAEPDAPARRPQDGRARPERDGRSRIGPAFVAFFAIVGVVASTSTWMDELHLPSVSDAFGKVIWERVAALVEPAVYVLAAAAAVAGVRWLSRAASKARDDEAEAADPEGPRRRGVPVVRRALWAFALAVPLAPVLQGPVAQIWFGHIDRDVRPLFERPLADVRAAFIAWAEAGGLPDDGFYRVAVDTGDGDRRWADLAIGLDRPFYNGGFTPVSNYLYKIERRDLGALEALNVRFVLTSRPRRDPKLREVARFGPLLVYRLETWRPEPFTVDGAGDVALERLDDRRVRLRAGAGARGHLRLHVSWFPRWRATRDGEPVDITVEALDGDPRSGFMSVPLAPGVYEFVFAPSTLDHLAFVLSLAGLLGALLLALGHRWRTLARPWRAIGRRLAAWPRPGPGLRLASGAAIVVAGAVAVAALGAWTPPLALDEADPAIERVRYDFLERLGEATVTQVGHPGGAAATDARDDDEGAAPRRCPWFLDRFVCPGDPLAVVGSRPARVPGVGSARCVSISPSSGRAIALRYEDVPQGHAIVGTYGLTADDARRRPPRIDLAIAVDGEAVFEAGVRSARSTLRRFIAPVADASDAPAAVTIKVAVPEGATPGDFCVYAQMVDFDAPAAPDDAPWPDVPSGPHERSRGRIR